MFDEELVHDFLSIFSLWGLYIFWLLGYLILSHKWHVGFIEMRFEDIHFSLIQSFLILLHFDIENFFSVILAIKFRELVTGFIDAFLLGIALSFIKEGHS